MFTSLPDGLEPAALMLLPQLVGAASLFSGPACGQAPHGHAQPGQRLQLALCSSGCIRPALSRTDLDVYHAVLTRYDKVE